MKKRDQWIQVRATKQEKELFREKGGSAAFRRWLNADLENPVSDAVKAAILDSTNGKP